MQLRSPPVNESLPLHLHRDLAPDASRSHDDSLGPVRPGLYVSPWTDDWSAPPARRRQFSETGGRQVTKPKPSFPNPAYRKEAGFFVYRKSQRKDPWRNLMARMCEPEGRPGRRWSRRDFPKLYSLRASEEVCPKHRNDHREMPVATAITTCAGTCSLLY